MYVHSFSYLLNKLELGGYTYLQLKRLKLHQNVDLKVIVQALTLALLCKNLDYKP